MKWDTALKFLALILGFGLWAYLGYMGKTDLNAMIDLLKIGLGALVYHMIGAQATSDPVAPPAPPAEKVPPTLHWINPPPGNQGGFSSIKTLLWIVFLSLVLASIFGCAAIPQQMVDVTKQSGENQVNNLKLLICNLPFFSVVAHPEMYDAVKSLCMPPPGAAAPTTLLPSSKP